MVQKGKAKVYFCTAEHTSTFKGVTWLEAPTPDLHWTPLEGSRYVIPCFSELWHPHDTGDRSRRLEGGGALSAVSVERLRAALGATSLV